jgi:hypothetical protein
LPHGSRERAEQDAERSDGECVELGSRKKSVSEPAIGTPSHHSTTSTSDRPAATRMTRALAMILESMISAGTTGMTSRCSTVPCSRSRMSAAPVSITAAIERTRVSLLAAGARLATIHAYRERNR